MNKTLAPRGLYIITDHTLSDQALIETTRAALTAGASLVQLRLKNRDSQHISTRRLAKALLKRCHQYHVPLIVNDDPEFAHAIKADGVHLGNNDASIGQARDILGEQAIIGASCYNSLELAIKAQSQSADYVAFGRFFHSTSKPRATPADISLLSEARAQITIPIVAIGGITPDNGHQLVAAGADYLAVINGVYAQQDPYTATRNYLKIINPNH